MNVSVIIVNYNVRHFLENTLVSVMKAMKGMQGEIIVADNDSDDGSVEMMREKFPKVKLIVNEHNLGFAAANNIAAREAHGEYLLFLNPDTLVQEDTLRTMVNFLGTHPEAGLIGCKILNPDGTLQLACRRSFPTPWVAFTKLTGLATLFPNTQLFGKYNLTYLNPEETYEVDAVSGSCMFMRKKIFEQVGGFDEQFFMYGEDLDLCYRVRQGKWKTYYLPATQIIHYKGESVRRSEIDEVKLFYQAMRIFVRKHLRKSITADILLGIGITAREWLASIGRVMKQLRAVVFDFFLVDISLLLATLIRFGEIFRFPSYGYPVIITVPGFVVVVTMSFLGVYSTRKLSFSRAVSSVVIAFVVVSALTFFFNQYAFSRLVVLISGCICVVLLPGWRLMVKTLARSPELHKRSLFGRATLIVGTDASGQEVLRKLRMRIADGYNVVGLIDTDRKRVGEKISGVEILGSIDNIGKVIQEQRVSEVIFSTNTLSYTDILAVIGRTKSRTVNFRLVPSSLDVIIGKTHIDELNDFPLVDIENNIHKPMNQFMKRMFDILISLILMITAYPIFSLTFRMKTTQSSSKQKILQVPKVFSGSISFVGMPEQSHSVSNNGSFVSQQYLGKVGLTGLVQLHQHEELTSDEIEKYNLYYAKNQSLLLDIEILLKSISQSKNN